MTQPRLTPFLTLKKSVIDPLLKTTTCISSWSRQRVVTNFGGHPYLRKILCSASQLTAESFCETREGHVCCSQHSSFSVAGARGQASLYCVLSFFTLYLPIVYRSFLPQFLNLRRWDNACLPKVLNHCSFVWDHLGRHLTWYMLFYPGRDGIPPYRLRKQHRREMQESAKANGRVPLPHIPRTYRMPKDIHVEPQKFAAELINRLEEVQKEREAEEKLEERLKRVRAEEEGEDADLSSGPSVISHKLPSTQTMHHFTPRYSEMSCAGMQMRDAHEENPESILDEHVQRVMKTPGCQSPGPGRHSPKPRSPESSHAGKMPGMPGTIPPGHGKHTTKSGMKLDAANLYHHKHVYHHIHHHSMMKPKEQIEAEATQRVQNSFAWNVDSHNYATKSRNYNESMVMAPNPMESLGYSGKASLLSKRNVKKTDSGKSDGASYEMPGSPEDAERNQKILQWIIEGEKEISRHKKANHGSSGAKKQLAHEMARPLSIERPVAVHPWVSAQLRNVVQPSHPFIQDPTMPPNPAPNPLTQLEEARRRLEEEEKRAGKLPPKQRLKPQKRPGSGASHPCENIVVAYYFCGEPIPYRTLVKGRVVTLGQFKELLTKKGNYRYYFKKVSDEFDCGVVFEEVREDDAILPIFEEKIIGKVEKID
uniref:Axin-1 n=1 Tax=Crocodylus porosus TaxID=8502 RepID=A0A7M4E5J5_CROPO